MAKKPKSPNASTPRRKVTLADAIQFLKDHHTVRVSLGPSATLEQRALKQKEDEMCQSFITTLENFERTNGTLGTMPNPESNYEDEI